MARNSSLVRYAVIAGGGWTIYNMAMNGSLGSAAQKAAQELSQAWAGSGGWHLNGSNNGSNPTQQIPSTTPKTQPISTAPQSGWLSTNLRDMGGVPVLYNPSSGTLKQDPNWVKQWAPGFSPNTYTDGVFQDNDGQIVPFGGARAYVLAV